MNYLFTYAEAFPERMDVVHMEVKLFINGQSTEVGQLQ